MISATVVGNGVSGFACAKRLAELGAAVTMIGPGLPYDRPPLSKRALNAGLVPLLADGAALAELSIRHLDGLVERIDPDLGEMIVRGSGGEPPLQLSAERIVWATGLLPATPPIAGLARSECNATAAGMESLAARLRTGGRRVVVIGAGLIGSETAATLANRHSVTLLDYAERPLARFHDSISAAAVGALTAAGVRFVGGCQVSEVTRSTVVTESHGRCSADVVVCAAGVRSSLPDALAAAPLATLDTDETLRMLGRPNIWACGDVARFPHPRYGPISIPHWDHARASGRHAAEAVMGSSAAYIRDPYWFSDIGRLRIQQLGRSDAAVEWRSHDGIQIGHDDAGRVACVVLLDAPHRLREARELVAA